MSIQLTIYFCSIDFNNLKKITERCLKPLLDVNLCYVDEGTDMNTWRDPVYLLFSF